MSINDLKIRDEALSDDPTQIKTKFGRLNTFMGDISAMSEYIPGGTDMITVLKNYLSILYFDQSTDPSVILIDNFMGDPNDIPHEVMFTVIPNNNNVPDANGETKITFKRGAVSKTYNIRRVDEKSVPNKLVANELLKNSFCYMYLSASGYMVRSAVDNIDYLTNSVNDLIAKTNKLHLAGNNYTTDGNITTKRLTLTQLSQTGSEVNTVHNLNITNGLTVAGVVNLVNAILSVGEPVSGTQPTNKDYVDTKLRTAMNNFPTLGSKFIVGVEANPSDNNEAVNAPIGTFYFKLKQ